MALVTSPQLARRHLLRIKMDTYIGMGFSNLIAFFIILSTAVTLHAAGITGIETSAQAAEALRPLATLGGVLLDFTPIHPIQALFWSAVINGVIAVPIMAMMMLMAAQSEVMGSFVIGRRLRILGWLATLAMFLAVVAMFVTHR